MKVKRTILIFSAVLALLASPAIGQTQCAPRDAVIAGLAERYGETRQAIGLSARNAIVEVFASSDSGTWTIIVTNAQGLSCLLASGASFEQNAQLPVLPGKGT